MSWDRTDASQALRNLQVPEDATIFIHANTGFLGAPRGGRLGNELAMGILNGSSRTVIVPAFSYSFGRGEIFDPLRAPSAMGVLSDLACDEGWGRSLDPMFSVWARGPRSAEFMRIGVSASFGEGSVFRRLIDCDDTYLVTVNLGAGSTLVHEIEHGLGVSYRFEKTFHGLVKLGELEKKIAWTSYVRDLNDHATKHDFRRLTDDLDRHSLRKKTRLGYGVLACTRVQDFRDHIEGSFAVDDRYLIVSGALQ